MISDKLSLTLCAILAACIFIAGLFGILGNFIVLTILTLVFLAIVGNVLYVKSKDLEETSNDKKL